MKLIKTQQEIEYAQEINEFRIKARPVFKMMILPLSDSSIAGAILQAKRLSI
jgi:hypothetical protein